MTLWYNCFMTKRRHKYDNIYTKQLEEAVFDQAGYDAKKSAEKERVRKENALHRKNIQGIFVLMGLVILGGIGYAINLDPDSSGPAAMFFAVFLAITAILFLWRR